MNFLTNQNRFAATFWRGFAWTVAVVYSFTLPLPAYAQNAGNCPGGICIGDVLSGIGGSSSVLASSMGGQAAKYQECDIDLNGRCDQQDALLSETLDEYLRSRDPKCDVDKSGKCDAKDIATGKVSGLDQLKELAGENGPLGQMQQQMQQQMEQMKQQAQQGGGGGGGAQIAMILLALLPLLLQLIKERGKEGAEKTPESRPNEDSQSCGPNGCG